MLYFVWTLLFLPANSLSGAILHHYDLLAGLGRLPDVDYEHYGPTTLLAHHNLPSKSPHLEDIRTEYVQLPVDHFRQDNRTFKNRFWVSQRSYNKNGPIFVLDVGEANAAKDNFHLDRLRNETSFFKQMVDRFNGIGIVWEHRYYGKSSPYNISLDTPASHFEFLTTEQALADIPTFAWSFKRASLPNVDPTPAGTPWVFIGASYAGMRAAFLRRYYPDAIHAAYASSAPVQAVVNMPFYFDIVWEGLRSAGFKNCTNDIKATVRAMDNIMESKEGAKALKEKFLGPTAGNNSNAGFADALSTIFYLYQGYGVQGGSKSLSSFCDWISRDPNNNLTAPEAGWAVSKGTEFTMHRWATWPPFTRMVNEIIGAKCEGARSRNVSADCNLDKRSENPSQIAWTWQYCSQWGYFQSSNLGEHQLLSKYNNVLHQNEICHRQFPDGRSSGFLPDWPNVTDTNTRYGGWNVTPSNTYWTSGELDPWRSLSVFSEQAASPRYGVTHDIPECGRSSRDDRNKIFGYLVPDSQHAFDFRMLYPRGNPAQDLWIKALERWLKCWKASKKPKQEERIPGGPVRIGMSS